MRAGTKMKWATNRRPAVAVASMPFAIARRKADGPASTSIPTRKVNHIDRRLSVIAVLIIPLLAGCVSASVGERRAVARDLASGEQVDYAGHRCGNPNLHVKTHPCVFPQRRAAQ
ncbi:hypothetical protein BW685_22015 [Burkholderia ubonensis]|uniref:Uncharacterized protein n=1 Tax=Burkholderia ubonensis TaxID=101571 RepID=A0A1R1J7R1_9BURK|nr:hypothetical protein BW685_22015 [Burkholderia ubonensis]